MKKICFITSTRADYGLQYYLMKEVQKSLYLEGQLIVTGTHLSEDFGLSINQIKNDGINIDYELNLGSLNDSKKSIAQQMSRAIEGFALAFEKLSPDLVVVLGDRYEILCAAQVAFVYKIPLLHIHGGEVTEGAFDDIIRHSITKMSTYHFTSAEEYQKRVIQMGEKTEHVFNLGAVGLEMLRKTKFMGRDKFEAELGFKLKSKNFLITYHPVTMSSEDGIEALISALKEFKDCGQIITFPNSDPGYDKIRNLIEVYSNEFDNVMLTKSLGSKLYVNAMNLVDVVIGNSSSGIIEAPFLGTATVNIGDRQTGRMKAPSVFDCVAKKESIVNAINNSLLCEKKQSLIFGDGHCAEQFVSFLEKNNFELKRGFHDL